MTAPRLHLVRWDGNTPRATCGVELKPETRWTAVRAYFHHPKYQPDMKRCLICKGERHAKAA
jgi:hypothetical protein